MLPVDGESQSLLRQRIPTYPTGWRGNLGRFGLNRFFVSESLPTQLATDLASILEEVSIASSSANPYLLEDFPERKDSTNIVSIASSSANPYLHQFRGCIFPRHSRLNRFFVSESLPTLYWPPHSAAGRWRLNRFFVSESLPTMVATSKYHTYVKRLNRFFVSESLPTWLYGDGRSGKCKSQSLLRQRIPTYMYARGLRSLDTKVSIASSSANPYLRKSLSLPVFLGRLNRFFVSESLPTGERDSRRH